MRGSCRSHGNLKRELRRSKLDIQVRKCRGSVNLERRETIRPSCVVNATRIAAPSLYNTFHDGLKASTHSLYFAKSLPQRLIEDEGLLDLPVPNPHPFIPVLYIAISYSPSEIAAAIDTVPVRSGILILSSRPIARE